MRVCDAALRLTLLLCLLAQLLAACGGQPQPTPPAPPARPASGLRIAVASEGIYRLGAADLAAAGLAPEGLDPARLQLFHAGAEQPLHVEGSGTSLALLFYGQPGTSVYARESSYVLRQGDGPGLRMRRDEALLSPAGRTAPLLTQTTGVVRAEENTLYVPLVDEGDRWHWAQLGAPQQQALTLTLPPDAAGPGEIRLSLWGTTEAPENPDHHARVLVNGRPAGDQSWDGKGRQLMSASLDAGALQPGANEVVVELPGDTGVAADIVLLDWVELRYARPLRMAGEQLVVEGAEGLATVEGAGAGHLVFDVGDPRDIAMAPLSPSGQDAGFWVRAGRRYLVHDPAATYLRPTLITAAELEPALRAPGQGADYLAIGQPELLEPLQPLLQLRETQGLKVRALPLQAIYDQYGDGTPEPEAIRALLREAAERWQPAPRYVLLVGDGSSDPRGYQAPPEANRLPTFLVQTAFGGETASDSGYAMLDGDNLPDLAVGRVPARTPEQVRAFVAKTIAYEQAPDEGSWRKHILAVADGQEANFSADATLFTERFGAGFETELLAPPPGEPDIALQVRERFEQGQLLVAYFGHGSVTQWGKDRLFSVLDSAELANAGKLPIVVNMTCLAGLFSHPKVESLAESLLWREGGGAVAVLAPTSLTLPTDQSFLSQGLADGIAASSAPLGELVLRAWRSAPADNPGADDVVRTFLLFGDPALRLVSSR